MVGGAFLFIESIFFRLEEDGLHYKDVMETISKVVDAAGVGVILLGAVYATIVLLRDMATKRHRLAEPYRLYRDTLGKSILLGLEFLIAGDIIRTVAVAPTFTNVGVLGILVVIRSILNVELEMEIDGYWPWQRRKFEDEERRARDPKAAAGEQ
jgi:uncharacterized membrane protein